MKKKEIIYKDLKDKIIEGKFKAYEVLKEEDLAEKYRVSRTPVREALQILVKEGFLSHKRKVGYIVKPLTKNELKEIVGIRSVLESYAAKLATELNDEKFIKNLEKLIERAEIALSQKNYQRFFKLNSDFHYELYKGSGNKKLVEIIDSLRENFRRYSKLLLNVSEEMPWESLKDHKEMLKAMKDKNPNKVEIVVKKHIEKGGKVLLEHIDNNEFLAFIISE